jgi:pimeloyl-ACP methyl ester carboxylesterase
MRLKSFSRPAAVLAFFFALELPAASSATFREGSGASPRPALVRELKDLLYHLRMVSSSGIFADHCSAILSVLEDTAAFSPADSVLLQGMYETFADTTADWNASRFDSYLQRRRPFILSWISPTDGQRSAAWLLPPQNWNPDATYPMTVNLHGLWDPAYGTRIRFLCWPFLPNQALWESFEDGYLLLPWGRGNLWYQGISGTDVWESIDVLKSMFQVDPDRQYLVGVSMGGYGAWKLALEAPELWAAVGVYAGGFWYDNHRLLTLESAQKLKDVPVYIVCGTSDDFLPDNRTAYRLLDLAGNTNIAFATFDGGHEVHLAQWHDMYAWIRNFTHGNSGLEAAGNNTLPKKNGLVGSYPNPFNPETRIRFVADGQRDVRIGIFDLAGRRVRWLQARTQPGVETDVRWDGTDGSGHPVPAGIYLCRMGFGDNRRIPSSTLKICLVR